MNQPLNFWTVYYNPSDFPGKYVIRRFEWAEPTDEHYVEDTLQAIRRHVPVGLVYTLPWADDDPCIVEVWL